MRVLLALVLVPVLFPVLVEGAENPLEGRSIAELERLIEENIAARKQDKGFVADYQKFHKREESKLSKLGQSLARDASSKRNQESSAYYFFRYEMYKPSLDVLTRLKLAYAKSARRNFLKLQEVYIGIAWNYAFLGRPVEAEGVMQSMRDQGGFKTRVDENLAKIRRFPAMEKAMELAFSERDLTPREEKAQWKLCQTLAGKVYFPFREKIELEWMQKAFPKSPHVTSGEVDWALVLNAEKLMDFGGMLRGSSSFLREKAFQGYFAARNGDPYWIQGNAFFKLGKWKDSIKVFNLLKTKHPKHPRVEGGTVDGIIRFAKTKDKTRAKMDPLTLDWSAGVK